MTRQRGGNMITEAEIRVMQLQDKEFQQPPERKGMGKERTRKGTNSPLEPSMGVEAC